MDLDLFVEGLDRQQRNSFEILHELFLEFPGVRSKIRFNIPFYDYTSWLCYINPIKKTGGLELCFIKGKILLEYGHRLQSKDRKQVAGITIFDLNEALLEEIMNVFTEAIVLDESLSRKKK